MPIPKHQRIAANLTGEFYVQLKGRIAYSAYQLLDYRIADETTLQPDMLVVCGEINRKYLDFPPTLVVEILSPGTALKDRHNKYSLYESQAIPYYFILLYIEEVEIYKLEDGAYSLTQKGKDISYQFSLGECNATINFKEI